MQVVDTSIWIEMLVGSALGATAEGLIPEAQECIVPTLVQLELAKWLTREVSEEVADQAIAFTMTCVVVPLDTEIALLAAELSAQHKLSTADAIVYATARSRRAEVLTCDAHFAGLEQVQYLSKAP
jgi:predicted nucleic acid-binding protein